MPVSPTNLLTSLDPVGDAAYNTGPRANSKCFQGTRVDIVNEICLWAYHPSDRRIAWLHGPAGFGKSAVARTLADQWDQSNRLLGSFFFFRNSGEQSKAARLLPTLAYQLTFSMPGTKPSIERALRKHPFLLKQPVEKQFQKLIVDPIAALPNLPPHPWVIVIDGVDECDNLELISQFIHAITTLDLSRFPVLFFFSSRLERRIQGILHSPTTRAIIHQFSLLDFNANKDIQSFLKAQFTFIHDSNPRLMGGIPRPWPSPSDLNDIVRLVNGSFVFATALAKYVRDGSPPPIRLVPIVKNITGIDDMYKEILSPLWEKNRFQIVFSTIMLLKKPLSIIELESLLQVDSREITSDLLYIQSIVTVPDDDSAKVEIVHTSLRDFSTSLERSGVFYADTAENHLQLAISCLQVMSTTAPQGVFEEDAAAYASIYWLEHLHLVLQRPGSLPAECDPLTEKLTIFISRAFDAWFTTMMLRKDGESNLDLLYRIIEQANVSQPLVDASLINRRL